MSMFPIHPRIQRCKAKFAGLNTNNIVENMGKEGRFFCANLLQSRGKLALHVKKPRSAIVSEGTHDMI